MPTFSPAPVEWRLGEGVPGSYDGKVIRPTGGCGVSRYPCSAPAVAGPIYVPQGTPLPLKHEERAVMPPADSMFLFTHNQASPECCPSTWSTDRGCVCMPGSPFKRITV